MENIKIEILRYPTDEDWMRAKELACNTIGKKAINLPSDEWKYKILKSEHSPARTLMLTIKMEIPYYVSMHFVRHKISCEHYVTSQRNDRQSKYDRTLAPQGEFVSHIMDINLPALINMSHKRLCTQADPVTRKVMQLITDEVVKLFPFCESLLVPTCEYLHECPEFFPCPRAKKFEKKEN